eukprot:1283371-Alexandrium_andersonii.AAC.1
MRGRPAPAATRQQSLVPERIVLLPVQVQGRGDDPPRRPRARARPPGQSERRTLGRTRSGEGEQSSLGQQMSRLGAFRP